MRSFLERSAHAVLTLALSFQIIVGPHLLSFSVPEAHADPASGDPMPVPSGAAPADSAKRQDAVGINYGVDTNSGAFGTSIPIETPPGRLGVEPKLALSYSSASTAPTLLGTGWNLALPTVRNAPDAPYLSNAPYVVDGKRMIENAGDPGTFSTEQETYSKIRRTCSQSSCWFVIDDRGGMRIRLGANADSRLTGLWGVDRVEDAHGNYMTVRYLTDADLLGQFGTARDGQLLPAEIKYTGSAARAPWYSVRFEYERRPGADTYPFQSTWTPEVMRYRMKTIKVVGGDGATIRTYNLAYTDSSTGRGLLSEVSTTGRGTSTGPRPYTIDYVGSQAGFLPAVSRPPTTDDARIVLGDFNGDGRTDQLTYQRWNPARVDAWNMRLGTATGLGPSTQWFAGLPYEYEGTCDQQNERVFAGDWDGDGDADLFHYSQGCSTGGDPRWRLLISNGSSFTLRDWIPAATTYTGSRYDARFAGLIFADFDGDGRSEALVVRTLSPIIVRGEDAAPGWSWRSAVLSWSGSIVATGDFNGDRRTDLAFLTSSNTITAAVSLGAGTFQFYGTATQPANTKVKTGDFNGDGLTDLLMAGTTTSTLFSSTRVGFSSQLLSFGAKDMTVGDVDGDGRDDLIGYADTSGAYRLTTMLRRGATFMPGSSAGFPDLPMGSVAASCPYVKDLLAGDFTGDGRVDPILQLHKVNSPSCPNFEATTLASDAPAVDRLSQIHTPSGLTVQPWYQRSATPGLPISLLVVKELWLRDYPRLVTNRVLSPIIETHRYELSGGKYDTTRGELMGFFRAQDDTVERNHREITIYHQDLSRRGKPAQKMRQELASGRLLSIDDYFYRTDTTAPFRTELEWNARHYYTDGAPTAHTLIGYQYDVYGNPSRIDDYGLCARTDDDRHTEMTYVAASDFNLQRIAESYTFAGVAAPPSQVSGTGCTGSASTLVEGTRNEYDNSFSTVTRGDLTRTSKLSIAPSGASSWVRERDTSYRADGLPLTTTDARGFTSSITAYDPVLDMYPARAIDPLGHVEQREYDAHFGKPSAITDMNGQIRRLGYDGFGRSAYVDTPLSSAIPTHAVIWAYGDSFPTWRAAVKPYSSTGGSMKIAASLEFYDALGRPIGSVADGDAPTERVIRDRRTYWAASDRPLTIAPPVEATVTTCSSIFTCLASWAIYTPSSISFDLAASVSTPAIFSYDPLGRTLRRDNPDGSFAGYAHSVTADGFGLTETDEVGDQRRIYRDARGDIRRTDRWAASGGAYATTTYAHDARGKLMSIVGPLGATTTLTWNSLGRMERVQSPEIGLLTLGYDAAGNETSRTDARGVVTATAVDALGRPTSRTTSLGEIAMWVYDRDPACGMGCSPPPVADNTIGRPWAVLDASGFTTFAYDGDGHLARETRSVTSQTLTTRFTNWPTGAVTAKTYPDGEVHRFELAPDGQPRALYVGTQSTPTVELTRDAMGRNATVRYETGVRTEHHVDPITLRTDAIDTFDSHDNVLQHVGYQYRPDGIIESADRSDVLAGSEQIFTTHDGAKRITDVFVAPSLDKPAEIYRYDAEGSMTLRKDRDGDPDVVEHQDASHPHATTRIGARSYHYDAAGNRLADSELGTYSYDGGNHMTAVGDRSYVYDADGRRVIERRDGATRVVAGDYTVEADGSTRKTLRLGTTRVGERSSGQGNRFVHADLIGSVIGETDDKGAFDTSRTFSAYGMDVGQQVTTSSTDLGFGGYQRDGGTGLSYALARYYDPATASFTQPDSWLAGFDNPDALNAYAFAANSPYQYSDPSGHVLVPLIVGFFITFAIGMSIDIVAAKGHPDWAFIIGKNLVIAAVGTAGMYGATSLAAMATFAQPTFFSVFILNVPTEVSVLFAGGGLAGAAMGLTAQYLHNIETKDSGGYLSAFTSGFFIGGLSNLGFGWNRGGYLHMIGGGVASTVGVRIAVNKNDSVKHSRGYRFDAPAPATAAPACGRSDAANTLPMPCEVLGH